MRTISIRAINNLMSLSIVWKYSEQIATHVLKVICSSSIILVKDSLRIIELTLLSSASLNLYYNTYNLQFKMHQTYTHPKHTNYDEFAYTQWSQLPPNLPLPNASQVSVLLLTIDKILYLNQLNDREPLQLKLQWWGMRSPQVVHLDQQDQNSVVTKYIICCPNEGLLSYLTDMKLLTVDVSMKKKSIGKAYINFTILKGWKGQNYEGVMDIKQNKKKIGEMTYQLQIKIQNNPYLSREVQPRKETVATVRKSDNIFNNRQTHFIYDRGNEQRSIKQQSQLIRKNSYEKHFNYSQKDALANSSRSNSRSDIQDKKFQKLVNDKQLINHREPTKNGVIEKRAEMYEMDYLQAQKNKDLINYEKEMIGLVQDFNNLFQINQKSLMMQEQSENTIQIQIVKLVINNKVQQNEPIEVIMPLPNAKTNIYKIITNGIVKVIIGRQVSKDNLMNYLKNSEIEFETTTKYRGSIKLSKVLAKYTQILEIPLFQREKKDTKMKQRGSCFIKLIPPPKTQNDNIQQKQPKKQSRELNKKQEVINPPSVEQYVSVYVKRFIPLEVTNRRVNICVKILETINSTILTQTKTVWNQNQFFLFDDKITFKIIKDSRLMVNLFDRQQKQIKIGEAEIAMESPIGVNLQIPIYSKYMNKSTIIGYLQLDYVKNGLNSVTKMVDILSRIAINPNHPKQKQQNVIEEQQKKPEFEQRQSEQAEIVDELHSNKQIDHDDHLIQTEVQEAFKRSQQQKYVPKLADRNICQLEIYNILFTYLYQNTHLLQSIEDKNQLKITQFLDLFSQLTTKNILSLKQINIIIAKHLFSNKGSDLLNKVNVQKLKNSYQAFCTYYEDLIEQRDNILKDFLQILDNVGMGINDLQSKLKNNKHIWEKMNDFLSFGKGDKINIVQDLRKHYLQSNKRYLNSYSQISGSQFCDILRRFEVYESTVGEEVDYKKISAQIYHYICEVLVEIQPYVESYNYRQLISLLENEQIILSSWQKENLQFFLGQRMNAKRFVRNGVQPQIKKEVIKEPMVDRQYIKQNLQESNNKPTISKSPTFGYLHAPEALKGQIAINQNQMVDSLAVKMHNLPISPINYQSSKENIHNLKVAFTNLKYKIKNFAIDGCTVSLNSMHQARSKNISHNEKQYMINKIHNESGQSQQHQVIYDNKTFKSMDYASKKEYESANSQEEGHNIEVSLQNVNKKFSYQIEINLGDKEFITVQCLHEQWTALVTEEGDYLGTILVY